MAFWAVDNSGCKTSFRLMCFFLFFRDHTGWKVRIPSLGYYQNGNYHNGNYLLGMILSNSLFFFGYYHNGNPVLNLMERRIFQLCLYLVERTYCCCYRNDSDFSVCSCEYSRACI